MSIISILECKQSFSIDQVRHLAATKVRAAKPRWISNTRPAAKRALDGRGSVTQRRTTIGVTNTFVKPERRWLVVLVIAACGSKTEPAAQTAKASGRVEIVYEIDLDSAIVDRAEELRRDLEVALAASKILAVVKSPLVPLGAVTVVVDEPGRKIEVEALVKSNYGDTIEWRDCDATDPAGALCLRVSATYGAGIRKAALQNAVKTIRDRLDARRLDAPSVVSKGETIVVEIDADALEARDLIVRTGKLEFKAADTGAPYMQKLFAHVGYERGKPTDPGATAVDIRAEVDAWRDDSDTSHQDYYLIAHDREERLPIDQAKRHGCNATPDQGHVRCALTGEVVIRRYLDALAQQDASFHVPDDRQVAYERVVGSAADKDRRPYWRTHYLERHAVLTGSSITNATTSNEPNTGQVIVLLDFNRNGSRVFGELTARLVGKKLAIILDGRIKSAPVITGAIRGGRASITMGGSDPAAQEREAQELVTVLKTGSLPAPLREASRRSW